MSGFGHGAGIVLACSALVVVMLAAGLRPGAALLALAAAAWTALVMYQLPGSLTSEQAWQTDMAWGAYVALLGALIVLASATTRRGPSPARAGLNA